MITSTTKRGEAKMEYLIINCPDDAELRSDEEVSKEEFEYMLGWAKENADYVEFYEPKQATLYIY